MGDEIKLRVSKIEKSFPGVKALDKIDFSVRKGTVHALCGENGAGKSTLMKIINGIYKPDAGEIFIDEEPVKIKDPIKARSLGIAMIAQELNYVPEMSVEENIFLGRLPADKFGRVKWGEVRSRTLQLLQDEHLPYKPTDKLKMLTTSDIQMLEIMKAISNDASIIVMDEPTSSITQKEVELLFKKIDILRAKGCAIVYISHKMDEVFRIADDITVFRDGTVVKSMRAADTNIDEVIALMVGRRMENVYPKEDIEIGEPLLEVENLRSGQLFENVNFHVNKGEIVGFAGLVGAGRTEVMRCLFGLDPIDGGTVKVHGEEIKVKCASDSIKHGMVMLSEDRRRYGIIPMRSVRENASLSSLEKFFYGGTAHPKKEAEVVGMYFDKMSVKTPTQETAIQSLSGGNQQKVILGRWLLTHPEYLILDEPTRGIDIGTKIEIQKLVLKLASEGMSVTFISSETDEMLRTCSRLVVMRDRKVVGELSGEDLTQGKVMETIAGGEAS